MNDKHYTKPRGFGAYTPNQVIATLSTISRKGGHVRPLPYYSLTTRLRQAWDVLTYRADALYWKERDEV